MSTAFSITVADRLDVKILDILWRDGRITKARMSEEIGLSPPRCWERMKRMEKTKLIRSYHADVNLAKLAGLTTFFAQVHIKNYSSQAAQMFEAMVRENDNVLSCQRLLGSIDYLIIIGAFGIEHYQEIIEKMMNAGLVQFDYTTFPVVKTVKTEHAVSLAKLLESRPADVETE